MSTVPTSSSFGFMETVINSVLVQVLVEVARSLGIKCHVRGTMLTIEGPRFSSRAESLMFRQWGADVINMTTVPEVVLAKEAGLCYASIAMATDYDCWKEHEEAVSGRLEVLPYFFNTSMSLLSLFVPCVIHNWQRVRHSWCTLCDMISFVFSFCLSSSNKLNYAIGF